MHVYLVKPGDTLGEIAARYRVSPGQLVARNDLPPTSCLLPGQALYIPSRLDVPGTDGYTTYQVKAGDTARALARRWQIPVTWLSLCNHLEGDALTEGEILLVPRPAATAPDADARFGNGHSSGSDDSAAAGRRPRFGLMRLAEPAPSEAFPHSALQYIGVPGLYADAAGHLHVPEVPEPAQAAHKLLICTLAGSAATWPDAAQSILRNELARNRLLDGLAHHLRSVGGDGVIFAWQAIGPRLAKPYLKWVKEAGERLKPLGLRVGLHLPGHSPLLKKTKRLLAAVEAIDHVFLEPTAGRSHTGRETLRRLGAMPAFGDGATLVGLDDVTRCLTALQPILPFDKTWLVLRPSAHIFRRGKAVQKITPHQALRLALAAGVPLLREPSGEQAWFRCPGEGGYSVWYEDLWSLVRKLDLLDRMKLQGLALWEQGAYMPDAWHYLSDLLFDELAEQEQKQKHG